jgi:hypothetical protein
MRVARTRSTMPEAQRLAPPLVADVVGYSRLAGTDDERTLARLLALRSALLARSDGVPALR